MDKKFTIDFSFCHRDAIKETYLLLLLSKDDKLSILICAIFIIEANHSSISAHLSRLLFLLAVAHLKVMMVFGKKIRSHQPFDEQINIFWVIYNF